MAERKGKEGRKGKGVMLLKLFIKKKVSTAKND